MNFNRSMAVRLALLISLMANLTILSKSIQADTGTCSGQSLTLPFTDVAGSNNFFCSIAAAYFSGITAGTSATTYSPAANVTREQMAAFVSRTLEQSVKRGNPRAALGEWWTNQVRRRVSTETGFPNPRFLACDGDTVWVSNTEGNSMSRIDIKTGALICNVFGILSPQRIVIVSGYVYVVSYQSPGKIHLADMKDVTDVTVGEIYSNLGPNPVGITYDGLNLWTANNGTGPGTGSLSRVSRIDAIVTNFSTGFSQPVGILFDGANLWVTDAGDTSLKRVDTTTGAVLQTIPLSGAVQHPVFDGTNLWIPCVGIAQLGVPDKVFVVRGVGGLTGTVLAQLTGNGLSGPFQAAFDGERICVTNSNNQCVSLWKASDLSPIGAFDTFVGGYFSRGVCSDGTTFFIGLRHESGGSGVITRF
jgi:DNA-binding beta-propeller fold protein YncE